MNLLRLLTYTLTLVALLGSTALSQITTTKSDPPKAGDATRVGLVAPRVTLLGGGGSVMQEANSLRQSLSSYLTGPRIGTVDLRAKLDSLALEEGKERSCDYVLYISLTRKRQTTARTYGGGTKAGDEFVFTFKVVSTEGQQTPVERVLNGTASTDGQDVLTPMVETAAQVVVELAKVAKPARPQTAVAETKTTPNDAVTPPTTTPPPQPAPERVPTGYGSLGAKPKGTAPGRVNDPPKQEGTIRIGLVTPRMNTGGTGGQSEAASLRSAITSFLAGSNIETIDLKARLDNLVMSEAGKRECDFVLYTTLLRKRASSSKGGAPFESIMGNVGGGTGSKVPGSKVVNEVSNQAARVSGTIASLSKANDEITFEYKLVTSDGARPVATKSTKAKVKSDGEDVLTPMIESAAQAILEATAKQN